MLEFMNIFGKRLDARVLLNDALDKAIHDYDVNLQRALASEKRAISDRCAISSVAASCLLNWAAKNLLDCE